MSAEHDTIHLTAADWVARLREPEVSLEETLAWQEWMTKDPRHAQAFERMEEVSRRKPTVHAMVNDLDETDRRLMAIDHHINSQNEELAREIEALRQEEK